MHKPITAVWEITMGCNMRCKHCGSICESSQPDELTTEEALKLCEDLGKLGLESITISGGEPTIRKDWVLIIKKLKEVGVVPSVITNGWLLSRGLLKEAKESGVDTIAISIDGFGHTHDKIRKSGSFERSMNALKLINEEDMFSAAITTINQLNFNELERMYNSFEDAGVNLWQLQFALPMGNFKKIENTIISPEQIDQIIDFAYEHKDGNMQITFADCIGYYNQRELEIKRKQIDNDWIWKGCSAGKNSFGILHNGDIVGCTSMRNSMYIEGNIRNQSIIEIWNDLNSFSWNRRLKKCDLKGLCAKCQYGNVCLGGCSNSRECINGTIHSENLYCSFNNEMKKIQKVIEDIDKSDLLEMIQNLIDEKQYQVAEFVLLRLLMDNPNEISLLNMAAFVNYNLGNYTESLNLNNKIIKIEPTHINALKGKGISLWRLDQYDEAISTLTYLKKEFQLDEETMYDVTIALNDIEERKK